MLKDNFKKCTAFKMHLRSLPQVLQFFKKTFPEKKKSQLEPIFKDIIYLFIYLFIIIIIVIESINACNKKIRFSIVVKIKRIFLRLVRSMSKCSKNSIFNLAVNFAVSDERVYYIK